jgi:HSP20 family protein
MRAESPANNGIAWEPWNDLRTMDRIFDGILRSPFTSLARSAASTSPVENAIELYETKSELIAFLFAPGLNASSFEINATGESISITAERKPLIEPADGVTTHTPWQNMAVSSGTFSTSYTLPVEIDPAKVSASYADGVLKLTLPKSEAVLPKQVKVEVGK